MNFYYQGFNPFSLSIGSSGLPSLLPFLRLSGDYKAIHIIREREREEEKRERKREG